MSPGCYVFLDFPCFWSPWQIWAVLLKYFRDCSSIWLCQISFPWWNRIYGFGRGKSEKTSTMLITYQEYIWSMWLINADVNLDLWAEVVFYRVGFFFFHCNVTFPLLPTLLFGRSYYASSILKKERVMLHLSEDRVPT